MYRCRFSDCFIDFRSIIFTIAVKKRITKEEKQDIFEFFAWLRKNSVVNDKNL